MKAFKPTGVELAVCKDIAARQQMGIKKYGVPLSDSKLTHRQLLQHAYEETLDRAMYLKAAIEQLCPRCGAWIKDGICPNHGCES
jgi:hypothetical protein